MRRFGFEINNDMNQLEFLKQEGKSTYILAEIGEYHGLMSVTYSEDGKYEEYIMLNLFSETRESIWFYAEMIFNEVYTEVDSIFGYRMGVSKEVKKIFKNTALYEVIDKYESNQPITLPVFIDLVSDILKESYGLQEEVILFNLPKDEIVKYYKRKYIKEEFYPDEGLIDYLYASKSIFHCRVNNTEELIINDYNSADFPEIILGFKWLKKLELYELLVSEIPEEITILGNLISLSIMLKFLNRIPSSLFRLKNLEVLKIERSSISELNLGLFDLQNLKELYIVDNENLSVIPNEISKLRLLEFLYIYDNKIKSLPKTIAGLENLKVLHLTNNLIEDLPDELTALPNLKVINLSNNRLKKIPEYLFEMESIQEIDLSKNPMLDKDKVYELFIKASKQNEIKLII